MSYWDTKLEDAVERLANSYAFISAYNGPCGLCGGPDQRHRIADAMSDRYEAGELIREVAEDYGLPPLRAAEVIAANLTWRLYGRRARATQRQQFDAILRFWPMPDAT